MPAGRARLADRKLAATGVEREAAVVREAVRAHELWAFALGAEAEVFDLHHVDDRIVVICLEEIQVRRLDAGLRVELVAVEDPTAALLHRVLREGVEALHCPQQPDPRQAARLGVLASHHQERIGTGLQRGR